MIIAYVSVAIPVGGQMLTEVRSYPTPLNLECREQSPRGRSLHPDVVWDGPPPAASPEFPRHP